MDTLTLVIAAAVLLQALQTVQLRTVSRVARDVHRSMFPPPNPDAAQCTCGHERRRHDGRDYTAACLFNTCSCRRFVARGG